MAKTFTTLLLLILCCWNGCLNDTILPKQVDEQPEDVVANDSEGSTRWPEIARIGQLTLELLDGSFAIIDAIQDWILPQPTTEDDLLDGVKRLEDLIRPDEGSQYKKAEDAISRALFDVAVVQHVSANGISELQKLLWLERARLLNGEIVLLMEGLLGQPVTGSDLSGNIQEKKKCNVTEMWHKFDRYDDLITNGTMAVNHFSRLGQMSRVEWNRRTTAVRERNVKITARNIQLVSDCLKRQLNETAKNVTSTEQLADQVAKVLSTLYPPPMRWIVAVHTNGTLLQSRAKSKLSADYAFHLKNYHVALFPFYTNGKMPIIIDGRLVDQFCVQPVREAGGSPICDVGANDGEYVYNELRRLGIVPDTAHLIVVPSKGQLSIRVTPSGSLTPFFAKRYPDFDIVAF